jgi:hypothetical protein
MCVFAHSRFVENPSIWSWETNPSFLRWFCHKKIQDYKVQDFQQQQSGTKASDPWPYWSYMLSLSSIHIVLHALIILPKPHTLGIWVHTWLALLSHAVMSVIQVFPSFVMLSLACVFVRDGLPSLEMWFNHGEDWYCGLSNGSNGGDG